MVLRWLQGRPGEAEAVLERLAVEQPSGAHAWQRLLPLAYAGQDRDTDARHQLNAAPASGRPFSG